MYFHKHHQLLPQKTQRWAGECKPSAVTWGCQQENWQEERWTSSTRQDSEGSIEGGSLLLEEDKEHWPASEERWSGPHVMLLLCSYLSSPFPCKANCFPLHLQQSGIANGLNAGEETNNYNTQHLACTLPTDSTALPSANELNEVFNYTMIVNAQLKPTKLSTKW